MAARNVVPEQRGWLVVVDDEDIYIAIIIEVAESATAAAMRRVDTRSGPTDQLLEPPISQIPEHHPRRFVGGIRELFIHLRIDAASHPENIRAAVVVQVRDAGAPAHKACLDTQAGAQRHISKIALAVVQVQDSCVFGEVSFNDMQAAVQPEIADAQAHASLLHPVFTQSNSPLQS